MDKQNVIYSYNGMLFIHKKKLSMDSYNKGETWKCYVKSTDTKDHKVCDSIYGKSIQAESILVGARSMD